jgi:hypothetical protein
MWTLSAPWSLKSHWWVSDDQARIQHSKFSKPHSKLPNYFLRTCKMKPVYIEMEPETQLTWTGSIPDCPAWVLEASHECSKHLRNKGFDSLSGETPFCVSAENTCTVVLLKEKRDTSQNWNDSEPHPYMVDILPSLSLSVAYIIVYCLWPQLMCCWF